MEDVVRGWLAAGALSAAAAVGLSGHWSSPAQTPAPSMERDQGPSITPGIDMTGDSSANDVMEILEITAEHEAGHVAAVREFGIPVWGVEIHDNGSGETVYPDHYFRDPTRDAYDNAVVDVAGQESAAAWLVGHRGYTQERALADTESSARYDLSLLREDTRRAGISEQEARQRARDIISRRRAEIDRTAQRLMEHGGYLDEHDLDEMER